MLQEQKSPWGRGPTPPLPFARLPGFPPSARPTSLALLMPVCLPTTEPGLCGPHCFPGSRGELGESA